MLSLLRCVGVYAIFAVNIALCFVTVLVLGVITIPLDPQVRHSLCCGACQWINYVFIRMIFWVRLDFRGKIDGTNLVIVSNHVSSLDMFVINAFLFERYRHYHRVHVVASARVLTIPIFGFVMRALGVIPVKIVNDGDPKGLLAKNKYDPANVTDVYEKCAQRLADGDTLFMFPEGKRNHTPLTLNRMNAGAFNVSHRSRRPIKILGIKGVDAIWPAKRHPIGAGTITIEAFDGEYLFDDIDTYRTTLTSTLGPWLQSNR